RLQISGHIRYFVEEQRAAVCRRNHSWKIVHGPGERAFDVPKKFSLDHRLRERRAIELHHRLFSAPAASVNRIGNHLLPTPLSPTMRTLASEGPIVSISSWISCIGLL